MIVWTNIYYLLSGEGQLNNTLCAHVKHNLVLRSLISNSVNGVIVY